MDLKSAFRKARDLVSPAPVDPVRVNTINNPTYSSTVLDPETGRRTVMGTGRKAPCAEMRASTLAPGAPRTAVVLGVARGGTSMVSGVLRGLGVFMGDNLGFNHEDGQIQRIVRQQAFDRFGEIAQNRNRRHPLWGFKFPEASLVMDRFHPELNNPHYLFVVRHPLARGMSVVTRTGGQLSDAVVEALDSYRSIFDFLASVDAPALLINYEQATAEAADCVAQIADFLGIEPTPERLDKAVSMIVDQGAGYVNLPEHSFFAVETGTAEGAAGGAFQAAPGSLAGREIAYAAGRASVWAAPEGGFPATFRLDFSLAGGARPGDCVRLYYDYDGRFHPGHRLLIELKSSTPSFRVETTGQLKRIAIVPLDEARRVESVVMRAEPA